MNKLLNNPPVIRAIVYILLAVMLLWLWLGEDAEAETIFGIGPAFVSGHYSNTIAITLHERFGGRWEVGLTLVGEQTTKHSQFVGNNFAFGGRLIIPSPKKRFELSFGGAVWAKQNVIVSCESRFTLTLGIAWNIRRGPWNLAIDHASTAGVCKPNPGQNILSIRRKFG
ncbi:hypothetical protein LCGC14_2248440 [marine sediment metagenome]|uniref:Acyloxyacyl hydrolase n=1 Tax=marine sediment metagenome TaxID=412755 RepID=A0A0F9FYA1_9ZZZZ